MAEREGFEPSKGISPYTLSKRAHSTTLPPLLFLRVITFFILTTMPENIVAKVTLSIIVIRYKYFVDV